MYIRNKVWSMGGQGVILTIFAKYLALLNVIFPVMQSGRIGVGPERLS